MSYRFEVHETVAEGVRRIAQEQLAKAVGELGEGDLDIHETIHQVRKRCKKVRGLVRVVRPAVPDLYDRENTIFRDAARTLAAGRDATAFIETYDALMSHYEDAVDRQTFGLLRAALTRRRDEVVDEHDLHDRLEAFTATIREAQERVHGWDLPEKGYGAVRGGLAKTYGRARGRMKDAYDEETDEAFHEWRKRVKYHLYHMRLMRNLWPPVVKARCHALDELNDLLGDDHDLAVFKAAIDVDGETFAGFEHRQAFLGLMDRRRGELQARARTLGQRLFAEETDAFVERFGAYWKAWHRERAQTPSLAAPVSPGEVEWVTA